MDAGRSRAGRRLGMTASAVGLALVGACTGSAATPSPASPTTTSPAAVSGSRTSSAPTTAAPTTATPTATASITVTLPGAGPRRWSLAQLLALPRTTVTAADGSTVTAPTLATLTGYAGPARAGSPDSRLLVVYRVSGTGTGAPMTFTRAETEASVGDHPALVTLTAAGRLDVVVPQDRTTGRSVLGVDAVDVRVVEVPAAPSPVPAPGSVEVDAGSSHRTVDVASLPRRDYALTRPGSATTRQQGARLADVLTAAGLSLDDATLVTVVGSTGQVAVLTGGEVREAQKEVGLSLAQDGRSLPRPQLVVGGDVGPARTVTSVTRVVVGS